MSYQLPLYAIAYVTDDGSTRMLSVGTNDDKGMFPIFTEAELAEEYREYFCKHHELKLMVRMVDEYEKLLNLIECIMLLDTTIHYVIMNPAPPVLETLMADEKVLTYELHEYLNGLRARRPSTPEDEKEES